MKERTLPELLAAVKAIPTQSLIFYTRYIPLAADSLSERNIYPDEIGGLIAEVAPVPIYASSEISIGMGVVGGMIRATNVVGARLGEIAGQILKGTPPEDIPIDTVPTTPIFDWRQVKRWGIDPSKLPPGSRILFRTPSAWESYRWYIIGTIVVVTTQDGARRLRGFRPGARIEVVRIDEPRVSIQTLLGLMAERGFRLVVSEAGPTLFGQLLAARTVDELFVTVAPQIVGRSDQVNRLGLVEGVGFPPGVAPWASLRTVMRSEDHLFLRYRLTDPKGPS